MQSFRSWPFYMQAWLISIIRCRENTGMPSELNLPLNRVCDFWSIVALVYFYEFRSTSVSSCPPLRAPVHLCELLSTSVSSCPCLWAPVHVGELLSTSVSFSPFLWVPVHFCEFRSTSVSSDPPPWVLVRFCEFQTTCELLSTSVCSGPHLWAPVHLWFQVRQLQCCPRSLCADSHWPQFSLYRSMGCWWLYSGCHPTQPLSAKRCWHWSEANDSMPTTAQETFPLLCASLSPGVRRSSELVLFLCLGRV